MEGSNSWPLSHQTDALATRLPEMPGNVSNTPCIHIPWSLSSFCVEWSIDRLDKLCHSGNVTFEAKIKGGGRRHLNFTESSKAHEIYRFENIANLISPVWLENAYSRKDLHQIWYSCIEVADIITCDKCWRSVEGCRFCIGSKFGIWHIDEEKHSLFCRRAAKPVMSLSR